MNWHSLSEFLAMGGYGRYVWGSYGLCLWLVVWEQWALKRRLGRAKEAIRSDMDNGISHENTQ